jgi:hypothetical protein
MFGKEKEEGTLWLLSWRITDLAFISKNYSKYDYPEAHTLGMILWQVKLNHFFFISEPIGATIKQSRKSSFYHWLQGHRSIASFRKGDGDAKFLITVFRISIMVLFERDSLHQKQIMFLGGFSRKDTEETTLLYTSCTLFVHFSKSHCYRMCTSPSNCSSCNLHDSVMLNLTLSIAMLLSDTGAPQNSTKSCLCSSSTKHRIYQTLLFYWVCVCSRQ